MFEDRYARQIRLQGFGEEGQEKMKDAKVLVIGAGGLGCPAAVYLAGAGIGLLGIADADEVSISNLHRQILHPEANVGVNKAESEKEFLVRYNHEIEIRTYPFFITEENAEEIIKEYDFIILAVDNFETRFLVNDLCVKLKIPFSHAGVVGFEGQALTYVPGTGPCYRCVFEEVPEPGEVPTAVEIGILGALAGIFGSIQAMEAVKYFTGIGELLTGRMYILDGRTMTSRMVRIPYTNPECKACGELEK